MLKFTVNHPVPDPIADAFIGVVNRLLPNGWRFSITPRPSSVLSSDPLSGVFQGGPTIVLVPGFGRLEQFDQFGTMELHGDAWRRRFRAALATLIAPPHTSEFALIHNDVIRSDQIFIDSYFDGVIDVGDLEHMASMDAAAALVHTLEESQTREPMPTIPGFETRHSAAMAGMEAQVAGGTRLESEMLTRPRGIDVRNPPIGRTFEMWVPYSLPGGAIRAIVRTVRRRTVVSSRLAGFPSIEAFRASVPR